MKTISYCQGCGAELDKTALEAFVIQCKYCGLSFVSAGGALGLTRATAINDPNLSREIIERAIVVCHEHLNKYNGFLQTNLAELKLPEEHYLIKPKEPELQHTEAVVSWQNIVIKGACLAPVYSIIIFPLLWALLTYLYSNISAKSFNTVFTLLLLHRNDGTTSGNIFELLNLYCVSLIFSTPFACIKYYYNRLLVIKRNGEKPEINATNMSLYNVNLKKAYETARIAKNTKDHQLRRSIVDIEGRIKMVTAEETEFVNKLKSLN